MNYRKEICFNFLLQKISNSISGSSFYTLLRTPNNLRNGHPESLWRHHTQGSLQGVPWSIRGLPLSVNYWVTGCVRFSTLDNLSSNIFGWCVFDLFQIFVNVRFVKFLLSPSLLKSQNKVFVSIYIICRLLFSGLIKYFNFLSSLHVCPRCSLL